MARSGSKLFDFPIKFCISDFFLKKVNLKKSAANKQAYLITQNFKDFKASEIFQVPTIHVKRQIIFFSSHSGIFLQFYCIGYFYNL